MSLSTVRIERKNSVALVTLDRPETGNALDMQMGKDLLEASLICARDTTIRAIVLTGAGKNFCFGGDLRSMTVAGDGIRSYLRELTTYLHTAIAQFARMDASVIAAVNGVAAGAGVGLVAMADLAVAGESTRFNLAYTKVGLTPDAGTSFFLPRTVGAKRAMELLLLNRTLSATEALDWGLVNRVVPDERVVGEAIELAVQLASGAVHAQGSVKRLMAHSLGALESHLTLESETIAAHAESHEGREGINAFLEKRPPQFS